MVDLNKNTVYLLLPDFTVLAGHIAEQFEDLFRIETVDGRSFYRNPTDIFYDAKVARARKFLNRFKMMLRTGNSMEAAWNSESPEITDLAVELWPEEFL